MTTVTVEEQVAAFPFTSVTVKVTGLEPTSEHVKLVLSRVSEAMPQVSDEPLVISAGVMKACPDASSPSTDQQKSWRWIY